METYAAQMAKTRPLRTACDKCHEDKVKCIPVEHEIYPTTYFVGPEDGGEPLKTEEEGPWPTDQGYQHGGAAIQEGGVPAPGMPMPIRCQRCTRMNCPCRFSIKAPRTSKKRRMSGSFGTFVGVADTQQEQDVQRPVFARPRPVSPARFPSHEIFQSPEARYFPHQPNGFIPSYEEMRPGEQSSLSQLFPNLTNEPLSGTFGQSSAPPGAAGLFSWLRSFGLESLPLPRLDSGDDSAGAGSSRPREYNWRMFFDIAMHDLATWHSAESAAKVIAERTEAAKNGDVALLNSPAANGTVAREEGASGEVGKETNGEGGGQNDHWAAAADSTSNGHSEESLRRQQAAVDAAAAAAEELSGQRPPARDCEFARLISALQSEIAVAMDAREQEASELAVATGNGSNGTTSEAATNRQASSSVRPMLELIAHANEVLWIGLRGFGAQEPESFEAGDVDSTDPRNDDIVPGFQPKKAQYYPSSSTALLTLSLSYQILGALTLSFSLSEGAGIDASCPFPSVPSVQGVTSGLIGPLSSLMQCLDRSESIAIWDMLVTAQYRRLDRSLQAAGQLAYHDHNGKGVCVFREAFARLRSQSHNGLVELEARTGRMREARKG